MINAKQTLVGTLNNAVEYIQPVTQEKNVTPSLEVQEITPDKDYTGLSKVTVEGVSLQNKKVTPSDIEQTITPDTDYLGLEEVVVDPIPSEYIKPTGTIDITSNGEHDVKNYEKANVNIPVGESPFTNYAHTATSTGPRNYIGRFIKRIDVLDLSNSTSAYQLCHECRSLEEIGEIINAENITSLYWAFYNTAIKRIDLSSFDGSKITNTDYTFGNSDLETLIINNETLFPMLNTYMFTNTPIHSGTGYIYVPDNMVEEYKSATNWSTYADQIKPISELEG